MAKIFAKLDKNSEFIAYLVQLSQAEQAKTRQFAMYGFEVLSELHLTSEQLTASKNDFMGIFEQALKDPEVSVRVSALRAIAAFFSGIDDQDVVMGFAPILPTLLDTVVEALKTDEDQGNSTLSSLGELTSAHPEVWKNTTGQLINIISQVFTEKSFSDFTRSAAVEVVLTLANQMPAALRKAEETRT